MEQWYKNLEKIKQIAIDITKEDSNVIEVKVKKDEISIKRKPKDAGDEGMKEIDEARRAAAAAIPDEYFLNPQKLPAAENKECSPNIGQSDAPRTKGRLKTANYPPAAEKRSHRRVNNNSSIN